MSALKYPVHLTVLEGIREFPGGSKNANIQITIVLTCESSKECKRKHIFQTLIAQVTSFHPGPFPIRKPVSTLTFPLTQSLTVLPFQVRINRKEEGRSSRQSSRPFPPVIYGGKGCLPGIQITATWSRCLQSFTKSCPLKAPQVTLILKGSALLTHIPPWIPFGLVLWGRSQLGKRTEGQIGGC